MPGDEGRMWKQNQKQTKTQNKGKTLKPTKQGGLPASTVPLEHPFCGPEAAVTVASSAPGSGPAQPGPVMNRCWADEGQSTPTFPEASDACLGAGKPGHTPGTGVVTKQVDYAQQIRDELVFSSLKKSGETSTNQKHATCNVLYRTYIRFCKMGNSLWTSGFLVQVTGLWGLNTPFISQGKHTGERFMSCSF